MFQRVPFDPLIIFIISIIISGCGKKPDEATQMVIDEITVISESDHYDIDAINTAYERYKTLTDKQKEMVTNYADLLKAQDEVKQIISDVKQAAEEDAEWDAFISPEKNQIRKVIDVYNSSDFCKYNGGVKKVILMYNDTYGKANRDWYLQDESNGWVHAYLGKGPVDKGDILLTGYSQNIEDNVLKYEYGDNDKYSHMWNSHCYGSTEEPTMEGSAFIILFDINEL